MQTQLTLDGIMLEVRNLDKYYGFRLILEKVSVSLPSSQLVILVGANGSGKTTILKTLSGVSAFQKADIYYNRNSVTPKQIRKLSYFGAHDSPLFDELTVYDNLKFFAATQKQDFKISQWHSSLQDFGIERFLDVKCQWLSAGTRQKVGLLFAGLSAAKFLYLDEPFSFLDFASKKILVKLFQKMLSLKKTIVLSLHDFEDDLLTVNQLWQIYSKKVAVSLNPSTEKIKLALQVPNLLSKNTK